MGKKEIIEVQGTEIVLLPHKMEDYISLTNMAKHKNAEATGLVIAHWLRTRYTIDLIGIWEKINNPNFNVTEFGNIKNESGEHRTHQCHRHNIQAGQIQQRNLRPQGHSL